MNLFIEKFEQSEKVVWKGLAMFNKTAGLVLCDHNNHDLITHCKCVLTGKAK